MLIRNILKRLFLMATICLVAIPNSSSNASQQTNTVSLPPLPTVWHIIWSDQVSVQEAQRLKAMGFDTLFKCVAHRPNYPNPPIFAAGEWRLVEKVKGTYEWNDLSRCLDAALQANMWVIPELVINIPPEWFVSLYPESILHDSNLDRIKPSNVDAPYLLSPWFVATGTADPYLIPLINSFLNLVNQYPNVAGIMLGNFLLNNLPWCLEKVNECNDQPNDPDPFNFWPLRDAYAQASYKEHFVTTNPPPSIWSEYQLMSNSDKTAFKDWLTLAIRENLQKRYLTWISSYPKWKVITASIWDGNDVRFSIFTTGTPEMTTAKQNAIKLANVPGIVINDDNMGDYGLTVFQQQDITLAHGNGFKIVGERVPNSNTGSSWSILFNMWQAFSPRPDSFINISEPDSYWINQFRLLYGPMIEPIKKVYLPIIIR